MAVAVQHPSLPPTGYMSASMHAATRDKQLPPPPAEQLHSTPAPAKITRANSRSFRPKLHTLPSAGIASSSVPSPASSTPRARPMSSFLPRSTSATFVNAVKQPKILSALVYSIEWPDFWSFANTCRDCRRLVGTPDLTDVVLSRFVPGYAQCLRACDLEQLKKVTVTLSDLHLLYMSQHMPLHRYPMHSLACQNALYPTPEQMKFTRKLVALTQTHSRFVLLLQSLTHSTSNPPPPELDDPFSFSRRNKNAGVPELTFPAPLCYADTDDSPDDPWAVPPPRESEAQGSPTKITISPTPTRSNTKIKGHAKLPSHNSVLSMARRRPSTDSSLSALTTPIKRRTSVFGGKKTVPPPPVEPRSLRLYASAWRRTLFHTSGGSTSDDEDDSLPRPRRHFASSPMSSSASSRSSPSPVGSRRPTMVAASSSNAGRLPSSSTPHDLSLATSRTRSPILRVFIPCATLAPDSPEVQACEDQLVQAGLWDHLSTGDIVCNLGYVPPRASPTSSSAASSADDINEDERGTWLLFDGTVLVPHTPPAPPPIEDPLSLPSPFYYAHITPPACDPAFRLARLPPCGGVPDLALVRTTAKVRSARSATGFAFVRRYAWTARVYRYAMPGDDIGAGWLGEWVLQGEGTKEGRQVLLDCIAGYENEPREWEMVREKSRPGRIWLRLVHDYCPPNGGQEHHLP
ncbi:hypothetical protein FB107DRAFT_264882 [Schizophyllum commune]